MKSSEVIATILAFADPAIEQIAETLIARGRLAREGSAPDPSDARLARLGVLRLEQAALFPGVGELEEAFLVDLRQRTMLLDAVGFLRDSRLG